VREIVPERDEKGRFIAGNKAGKGRPPKEYADAFSRVVSPEAWEGVIRRALIQAIEGHHDARAWLADRLIDKAPQILELRAAEAALLAELLKRFDACGLSAGDVFNAMLAVIAAEDGIEVEAEDA
jgi:hypothetical protein